MNELIATERLTKRFGSLTAVDQVNFQVNEGQVSGLIGPNGSGKTTLFNLLSGYFPPSQGRVTFQGQDLTGVPPHKRVVMGMARTFQLVSVFDSLTVWENLVLPSIRSKREELGVSRFFFCRSARKRIKADCEMALQWVGMQAKAFSPTSELSYGDKRMLEIAVALALKPRILLLDEPFAGLSDHEIGQALELIYKLKEEITIVIIEHKISKIVDLVKRLSVMNEGRIICEGSPEEVLADSEVRECYWGKAGESC